MPQGWTPDQIKQFQDYWDTEFAGDLAKRRRAKFVPGDTAAKVVQTKEPEHKQDFDEWLARIICFAFSVPPQWAVKTMNRATADNQSAQSEEEGLEPTKEWVKDLVDEIICEEFSSPDLELVWLDEDTDAAQAETALEARVKLGAVTLNEMRDSLGLDPFNNPAADRPMVLTPTGYVPIEANAGGESANVNANGQSAAVVQKYNADEPRVPKHNPGGGEWTDGEIRLAQDDTSGVQSDAFWPSRGRGHTWVPTAVYNKYKWKDETRNVFKNWTSGPLADPTVNYWSPQHDAYNDGVDDIIKGYLDRNNISSEQATPAQAREIVEEVLGSSDLRIRELKIQIVREALRYFRVYGPGRWAGDED